jgi:membrane associated rhomboid family serine protease/Tfp pilus assembly protein PilF
MIPVSSNIERRELPVITLILIGINIVGFLFEAILPDDMLHAFVDAQSYGPRNWYNPFAIFTSFFLHGSMDHLFFNMLFLWIFGPPMEERLGWKKYLGFYLGAGVSAAVLFMAMQFLQVGGEGMGAIGASGAVSGIMAIYIYRCYYAKLRLIIDPYFFKLGFSIPALPFVLFYFIKDLYAGINYPTVTGVAHWGHIGGFVFGVVAARIVRLGHEGRIEQLREKVNQGLKEGKGLAALEKELLKILELVPHDPEVKHDLARLCAGTERPREAMGYYGEAIGTYFVKSPLAGAYTVVECVKALKRPMDFKHHLKAAEVMVKHGEYADARKILIVVLKQKLTRSPVIERTLALFSKVNHQLGRDGDAKKALGMLEKGFPKSRLLEDVRTAMRKEAGYIFPPPVVEAVEQKPEGMGRAALGAMADVAEVAFDPFFLFAWIVTQIAVRVLAAVGLWPGFLIEGFGDLLNQIVIFTVALVATLDHRFKLITGFMGRRETRKAEKNFDATRTLEEARMAEKKEEFKRAAKLYEQHLLNDPGDLVSRVSLARLYQNSLGSRKKAIEHYRNIMESADPSAPAHGHATDALIELGEMEPPETYAQDEEPKEGG